MCAAPFPSWCGWSDLFHCIVSPQYRSQFAKHCAESIVNTSSQLQSRQRRMPTSDGRLWARRRRGLIRDMLRTCIECSLRWLQTGCLRLSGAPIGRSLRQVASRAAKEACCTSGVLETSAAVCGRYLRAFYRIPPSQDFGSLHFSTGPAQWSYDGSARRPTGALRIQSARIVLPLATKVNRSAIQCPRSHRQAYFAKVLQCLYASVEIRGASDGEVQVGSGSGK